MALSKCESHRGDLNPTRAHWFGGYSPRINAFPRNNPPGFSRDQMGGGKRLPPENGRPPGLVPPLHGGMIFDNSAVWADDVVIVKDGEIVV